MEKKEYIEREALINRLEYYYSHTSGDVQYAYGVALREARSAPAADVAPVVHGEWREDFEGDCYCTACGCYPKKDVENYCPNCGAKMDGGNRDVDA